MLDLEVTLNKKYKLKTKNVIRNNVNDADCDGTLSDVDCDDEDSSINNSNENDADCDGVSSDVDCDDEDSSIINSNENDADCDWVVSTFIQWIHNFLTSTVIQMVWTVICFLP